MATVNNLSDIVDNGLCIGCGLCQSIAGKDKIEVTMSPKGRLEPKEITKISPEIFDKILKKDKPVNGSIYGKLKVDIQ